MRLSPLLVVVAPLFASTLAGCPDAPPLTLGVTPQEHELDFPIGIGAPHELLSIAPETGAPISCDSCHAGTESFKQALCFSCHNLDALPLSVAHSAVAGYEPVDSSCLECHPNGLRGSNLGGATHSDLWFPIDATDVHGNAAYLARVNQLPGNLNACSACHASEDDRSLPLCVECHTLDNPPLEVTHQEVIRTFVDRDDAKCKECHADTPVNPVMRPLENHLSFFNPDHHSAKCTNCHEAHRAEPQPWALDFTVGTCTGCHNHIAACTPQNQGACN